MVLCGSSMMVQHSASALLQTYLMLWIRAVKWHGDAPPQGRQLRRRRHAELHMRLPQPCHAAAERRCESQPVTLTHWGHH